MIRNFKLFIIILIVTQGIPCQNKDDCCPDLYINCTDNINLWCCLPGYICASYLECIS